MATCSVAGKKNLFHGKAAVLWGTLAHELVTAERGKNVSFISQHGILYQIVAERGRHLKQNDIFIDNAT